MILLKIHAVFLFFFSKLNIYLCHLQNLIEILKKKRKILQLNPAHPLDLSHVSICEGAHKGDCKEEARLGDGLDGPGGPITFLMLI